MEWAGIPEEFCPEILLSRIMNDDEIDKLARKLDTRGYPGLLTTANDLGLSFEDIADVIEKHL